MSSCSRTPDGRRRRIGALVALAGAIVATIPSLLRHAGPTSNGSDALLGGIVSGALGTVLVLLIRAIRSHRAT